MSFHGNLLTCQAYHRRSPSTHYVSSRARSPPSNACVPSTTRGVGAIGEEVTKLLAAKFIKEVYHSDWLANPVLVKKKTGKWRMCVDYTGLNKACLKDHFPLPYIDQIVDSTS